MSEQCLHIFFVHFPLDFFFYLKELYKISKLALTLYMKYLRALPSVMQIDFLSCSIFYLVCGTLAHGGFNLYAVVKSLFFFFFLTNSSFGILLKQTGLFNSRLYFKNCLCFLLTFCFLFFTLRSLTYTEFIYLKN